MSNELVRTVVTSPIGLLTVVAHDTAIVAIHFPYEADAVAARIAEGDPAQHSVLAAAVAQLDEYFAGQRTSFDLPLDPDGTDFQRAAWDALVGIPFGETVSYGDQALRMGDKNKARAVGAANGKNPIPIVVPCHRVVGSDGKLTGFAGGLGTKAWLLDHEFAVRTAAD